jgi:hypothetical protein
VSRALRLAVGAALSLVLLAFFARGVQYVYTHYARPAESGLVDMLEYLFRPRPGTQPDQPPDGSSGGSRLDASRSKE